MSDYLTVCEQAARAGAAVLLEWQGKITPWEKQAKDLVTQADVASQRAIRRVLLDAFPDHQFLGEERLPETEQQAAGDATGDETSQYRWLVDPLDGTTNYVHRLRPFAVSIALERAGQILVGTVLDPISGECFTAEAGRGAWLNGQRIRVSGCRDLSQALVAASFSANVPRGSPEVARFIEVLHSAQAVRRLGSAALNLCYIAAGRLDGYFATSVKAWDVAAGVLLVREAGGVVTDVAGGPFDVARPTFAAAATEPLHRQLLAVLAGAEAGQPGGVKSSAASGSRPR